MKIVFVSFEYPPDTAFGGIATYVRHASQMLTLAGHHVEVICGSRTRSGYEFVNGVHVSRIEVPADSDARFGKLASRVLSERHEAVDGFDVLESAEYRADGAEYIANHPNVPLVVKLHTPSYLVDRLTHTKFGLLQKVRFAAGAIRLGTWPQWPQQSRGHLDQWGFERDFTRLADIVTAPSKAIARVVGKDWNLLPSRLSVVPNPSGSDDQLLNIPHPSVESSGRILYVGRLEPRKGVQHLAPALRLIRKRFPHASLRCVGQVANSPMLGKTMDEFMRDRAGSAMTAIEFTGGMSRDRLTGEYAKADVCVFPSQWENFPYVCLEAMSAARAIVGSSAGGMAEMLDGGAGVLVAPGSPRRWANAIISLLTDGDRRRWMGERARATVSQRYSYPAILGSQLAGYEEAIRYRKAQGARRSAAIPCRPL